MKDKPSKSKRSSRTPNATPLPPYHTVGDALRPWDTGEQPALNHVFHRHKPEMVERLHKLKPGESLYPFSQSWVRLHADRPAPTVMGNHGAGAVHPWRDRCLTPRELAALQGFPDDYVFCGSKSDQWLQIGNAVPVDLARAVGMACAEMLAEQETNSGDGDEGR